MTQARPAHSPPSSVRPDPDPTERTIEQLKSEIAALRELTEAMITGVKTMIETRLAAMDMAIVLVRESTEKFSALIDAGVDQLKEVDQVKFDAIRDRFADAKSALDVALQSASKAVDAAFSAAKEAASKIEVSFARAIEQLQTLGATQQKATDVTIGDLKVRLTALESIPKLSPDSIDGLKARLVALESTPRLSTDSLDAIKGRLQSVESRKEGSNEAQGSMIAIGSMFIALVAALAAVGAALMKH